MSKKFRVVKLSSYRAPYRYIPEDLKNKPWKDSKLLREFDRARPRRKSVHDPEKD